MGGRSAEALARVGLGAVLSAEGRAAGADRGWRGDVDDRGARAASDRGRACGGGYAPPAGARTCAVMATPAGRGN